MNPDLYTSEYRNFRYLKSSPDHTAYFRRAATQANRMQIWDAPRDPGFSWKTRVEFMEQLIDLRQDEIYICVPKVISPNEEFEPAYYVRFEKPTIVSANPLLYLKSEEVGIEDIESLEDVENNKPCLCEEFFHATMSSETLFRGRVFKLNTLPVVPNCTTEYIEIFRDETEAKTFCENLSNYLRNILGAVSSFASHI